MTDKTVTAGVAAHAAAPVLSQMNGKAPMPVICFNQACNKAGTHFPVLLFGPHGRVPGEKMPYHLEVPKAVCLDCQKRFNPDVFVTDNAKANIEVFLKENGHDAPDYSRLYVTWRSLAGPDWAEVKAAGEVRLWIDG